MLEIFFSLSLCKWILCFSGSQDKKNWEDLEQLNMLKHTQLEANCFLFKCLNAECCLIFRNVVLYLAMWFMTFWVLQHLMISFFSELFHTQVKFCFSLCVLLSLACQHKYSLVWMSDFIIPNCLSRVKNGVLQGQTFLPIPSSILNLNIQHTCKWAMESLPL